ncbi:BadF/BadG/BcrA/BcrD ATPase family protein [Agaribacterium haliotis]|uniref:BadF/BadG/BcrA/BcrD ATPase family protein n=1 Tax=Agaribacterium haliotis TaxID=2013869 RepID=UPI000BB53FF2|nr:BadF/BadG/BcrA/BcrD ATPase family protein [Agaribacterium haliotis]
MSLNKGPFFVGVDGGGSKCRAIVTDANNNVLGRGIAGPANIHQNWDQAINAIHDAVDFACAEAELSDQSQLIVGMGLAGMNMPRAAEQMKSWVHPWLHMFVTTDLHIACLAAHDDQNGAVIVLGTGSCAFSLKDGRQQSWGGYGFPFGDQASGAWFGMRAIQQVLLALDGLAPSGELVARVQHKLGVHSATELADLMGAARQSHVALLAPLVFDAADHGDVQALALLDEAQDYVKRLLAILEKNNACSVALVGSVAERLRNYLSIDLQRKLHKSKLAPEFGALSYAHACIDELPQLPRSGFAGN